MEVKLSKWGGQQVSEEILEFRFKTKKRFSFCLHKTSKNQYVFNIFYEVIPKAKELPFGKLYFKLCYSKTHILYDNENSISRTRE